jgi:hypothetical protein
VPAVERQQARDAESLAGRDERGSCGSERQVGVPRNELGDPDPVLRVYVLRHQVPGGERADETQLDRRA